MSLRDEALEAAQEVLRLVKGAGVSVMGWVVDYYPNDNEWRLSMTVSLKSRMRGRGSGDSDR